MNTMPKDTSLTEAQKKMIGERAAEKQKQLEKYQLMTDSIMGRDPKDVVEKMQRRKRAPGLAMLARDRADATQQRLNAEKADAAAAKKDAFNDLAERIDKIHLNGQGRSRRKRKSRGGRKKRSTRRKL